MWCTGAELSSVDNRVSSAESSLKAVSTVVNTGLALCQRSMEYQATVTASRRMVREALPADDKTEV